MDRYLCLFLFLFLTLFVEMRGGRDECMTSNRCGDQGPLIQFPFRLQDQPRHCGYPGFELSCTENDQTMLELPGSVKLLVKDITYKSREIIVQDPDNCLARQLRNLNLAASPFHFKFEKFFTFFNCSSDKTYQSSYIQSIPCLSIPGNPVYAVYSSRLVQYTDLSSCRRLYNASAPGNQDYGDYIFDGSAFSLKWSNSKICRLKKSNSTETECIKGVSKKIIVTEEMQDRALVVSERQTGASMMEQLVSEIMTHALSYLDYPNLCRLSMTNSLMRKAANDDNAWKALYHKKKSWNYKGKLMLESAQAFIEVEI